MSSQEPRRESTITPPTATAPPVAVVVPARGLAAGESWSIATTRRLLRNRKGLVGVVFLVTLVLVAVVGPYIAPYEPNELHGADQLKPPSATYWFGTDELGRDIFSRVVSGAAPALQSGVVAVVLAGLIGSITGLASGYFGGWI